ncbi:kinase-like domain-containing protein [Mycena galericulata]|nr:kinase-like domain-containing protein [Mycena galericulata]
MQDSDTDPVLCTGEDTCLRHFQYKTNVGSCHKCVLIANTPVAEHDRINALGQCSGCGNTSARLSTEYCGLCEKKNERRVQNTNLSGAPLVASSDRQAPDPLTSGVRNIGQFHRSQWKDAANFNGSSVKPHHNNLATNECYVFVLEPFVNSKACEFLPTFEVIREAAIKFSDIVASGIASFNSSWEDASESSLVRSDMRLSRIDNVHLEIEPQSSFRDVFHATLKDCGQNLDKTVPTKFRNRKFATLYMEAHIDVEKFHARTGVPPPPGLFKSKKRIWTENSGISLGSSVLKRTRLASAGPHSLKSSFTLASLASTATSVTLFFAEHTSDLETGVQSFNWCMDDAAAHLAMLEDNSFGKGRSKLVFKVKYNNMAYVAKRCYTVGNGQLVSVISNRDELVKEGTTLGRAKFFLNNFKEECDANEMDISDFEITDFILAREGILGSTEPFSPSPASGLTKSDYAELSDDEKGELNISNGSISSVTWLLERERGNVQFRKFSGTLEHPRYTDKQGATINVFQHFIYINSNKALVLADIQSSESHDASQKSSILFDLMSHTLTGDSGAGDHGDKGIQTFVDQHECGQRCIQLGLQALKDATEDD